MVERGAAEVSKLETVRWSNDEGLAVITLDNPPLNVLTYGVKVALGKCLAEINIDERARVVIITGADDRAFMAGADIKEFPTLMQHGAAKENAGVTHRVFNLLASFPKPTIAAINGLALGGGCELALCCDLRVMGENVQIGLPEIKLGLFPGAGGTQRLPRLIGEAKAKELLLLGELICAEEALKIGLVNRIAPAGAALGVAKEIGLKLAQLPGEALRMVKQAVHQGMEMPLHKALDLEMELIDKVFQTEDIREGIVAFLEKRRPTFKHH